jgi:hypothetical protein
MDIPPRVYLSCPNYRHHRLDLDQEEVVAEEEVVQAYNIYK